MRYFTWKLELVANIFEGLLVHSPLKADLAISGLNLQAYRNFFNNCSPLLMRDFFILYSITIFRSSQLVFADFWIQRSFPVDKPWLTKIVILFCSKFEKHTCIFINYIGEYNLTVELVKIGRKKGYVTTFWQSYCDRL